MELRVVVGVGGSHHRRYDCNRGEGDAQPHVQVQHQPAIAVLVGEDESRRHRRQRGGGRQPEQRGGRCGRLSPAPPVDGLEGEDAHQEPDGQVEQERVKASEDVEIRLHGG